MGTFGNSLWNQTPWGGDPGDPPDASVTAGQILAGLYPRLHAHDASDLVWWTEAGLLTWANIAVQKLARLCGVFVGRAITGSATEQAVYPLPVNHISTLQITYDGKPLRPSTSTELTALDPDYATTPGAPRRWYEDQIGMRSLGLAAVPTEDSKIIGMLHHFYPPELTNDASELPVPDAVAAYVSDSILASAYGAQGQSAMPEVAAFLNSKCQMLEQVFVQYWGPAQ